MNGIIDCLDWMRYNLNHSIILSLHGLFEVLIRHHHSQFLSILLSLGVVRPTLRTIIHIFALPLARRTLDIPPNPLQLLDIFLIVNAFHDYRNRSIGWFEIILCPIKNYKSPPEYM